MRTHEPAYSEDGMPKARYRLYHAERARGGIALTMTAGSAVMIQITHLGRRTNWNKADWLPVLAPSPIREPAHRAFPKAAEDWDIQRIVADYATAAQRMQAAGLDGIELEAYGHLNDQFWSPATNRRDDDYGGALDNRLRFTHRVLDAIRAAVGMDFIVGIRMVTDEQWERGLNREDGMAIAQRLVATGQVDFLNIIRGHIDTDAALSKVIPVHGTPASPHLDFAGEIRAATKFPVFHAARITDVATARHAVAEGKLDMVGMTRAHIAEPHIGLKVAEGREHEIRPCVGATYCLDRIYEGHEALCIHNPATGREATMPHVIRQTDGEKHRVVVVGAGPAGLEAARVSAERGHSVVLFEAATEPGGQVRLAARSPRRTELIGIIDWRMARCTALGVEMRFGVYAEAGDILAEHPDIVVIATGGLPNTEFLETGADLAVSSWDILADDVNPGAEVLLFDDNGGHQAMQAAEKLAGAGSQLEIVTPERFFAPEMGGLNHVAYAECFQRHGVIITINRRLLGVERDGNRLAAIVGSDYTDIRERRSVDQVVVEHGTLPLDEVYFALKEQSVNRGEVDYPALIAGRAQTVVRNPAGTFRLYRIGDAVSSRNIHAGIYDALRLCKNS